LLYELLFLGNVISTVLSKYFATSEASPDLIALITSSREIKVNADTPIKKMTASRTFFMNNFAQKQPKNVPNGKIMIAFGKSFNYII